MKTLQDLKQLFAGRNASDVASEIYGFSGFRTNRLEDLTGKEIEVLYNIYAPKSEKVEVEFDALKEILIKKEWKSKILALADKTGIKDKGSFHKFNDWMITSGKFKKHLNAHNLEELKELYKQLRGVEQNNARSSTKPMTKAWFAKAEQLKNLN